MKYIIKNFNDEVQEDGSTLKFVGFYVDDTDGNRLAIDKRVPATGTDEEIVAAAQAAAQPEIDAWQTSHSVIGREWDADIGAFVAEPAAEPAAE